MAFVLNFSALRDEVGVAKALSCSVELISRACAGDEALFQRHEIPKRNRSRGKRVVWEVADSEALGAYRTFLARFTDYAASVVKDFPHPCAHGYIADRSILTNATAHVGALVLMRADIRNFFGSISVDRVQSLLETYKVDPSVAKLLARFLTVQGTLALGLPSSPLIANLCAHGIDRDLAALAAKTSCTYTRYADDIAISGKKDLPSRIAVESVLRAHGFELATEKFKVKKRGQAFYVTGLSITDPARPRAPRHYKRRLAQELYYAETNGLHDHLGRAGYASYQSGVNKIDGRIRFLHLSEPDLAKAFRSRWKKILADANEQVAYEPSQAVAPRTIDFFVDESEVVSASGRMLTVGLAVVEDADRIRAILGKFLEEKLGDPFLPGSRDALRKNGLHWVDLAMDPRSELVGVVATLPFRLFVAYAPLPSDDQYSAKFLALMGSLLSRRLIAATQATLTIHVEQNSKVKAQPIKELIEAQFGALEAAKNRRPKALPSLVISTKAELAMTLVDTPLGVLHEYAAVELKPNAERPEYAYRRFEMLRMKYRLIQSDTRMFSRRSHFKPWPGGDPTA